MKYLINTAEVMSKTVQPNIRQAMAVLSNQCSVLYYDSTKAIIIGTEELDFAKLVVPEGNLYLVEKDVSYDSKTATLITELDNAYLVQSDNIYQATNRIDRKAVMPLNMKPMVFR